jgi:hypothetical protein
VNADFGASLKGSHHALDRCTDILKCHREPLLIELDAILGDKASSLQCPDRTGCALRMIQQ